MNLLDSPRRHFLLPWAVQEREDPVLEFDRGEGVLFYDRQGRRYLDFLSQLFHCNLGHGNPRVIQAIQRQAEKTCCVSPQLLTEERIALSQTLARLAPGDLNRCFFVNSGSEADDQAFILARLLTGRPKIFAKYRSYHGTTYGGLGVAGDPRRSAIEPGPAGAVRFFDPFCYRCDFGKTFPECQIHCLDALERQLQLENPATVAAIVVEPVTGAAGGFPLPTGYLPRLRQLCDRYGILLIADEVITGFGRTGAWFGVNHEGVTPDMMVLAKGLTSGYVPMGAVLLREPLAQVFDKRMLPLGSTFASASAGHRCRPGQPGGVRGTRPDRARPADGRGALRATARTGQAASAGWRCARQGLAGLPGAGHGSSDPCPSGAAEHRFAAALTDSPQSLERGDSPDGPRQPDPAGTAPDRAARAHRGGRYQARSDP